MTQHIDISNSPGGPAGDLLGLEWLLTNGRGSFTAGTVLGVNTRKYHGLLVAAVRPPSERAVLLANLNEELQLGRLIYPLSCFEFDGAFHPRGDAFLTGFDCAKTSGCIAFTYQLGGAKLVKRIGLARGADAIAVRYELTGLPADVPLADCRLTIAPLLAYRHYHHNRSASGEPAVLADLDGNDLRLRDAQSILPAMRFRTAPVSGSRFVCGPDWWYRFFYRIEADRGESPREDLFTPGRFELPFQPDGSAELLAAVEPAELVCFADIAAGQREHHRRLASLASNARLPVSPAAGQPVSPPSPSFQGQTVRNCTASALTDLLLAGDDFVTRLPNPAGDRNETISLLAGFPWFADWGRDAFISLPGLLLTTGQFDAALGVLKRFAGAIRDGLVPNRFSDDPANDCGKGGSPQVPATPIPCDYNSVDASLWFVHAAFEWAAASGDWPRFDVELLEPVLRILTAYHDGTKFNIHVDSDGLLTCGDESTQLTWMDAMVEAGHPITPRAGKPIEVNALFGDGLGRAIRRLGEIADPRARILQSWHDLWAQSFAATFPSPRGGLYDYIGLDGRPNAQIRPNQLLAVSLGPSPLPVHVQREVVRLAIDELRTPFGLRTLAPGEPEYQPHYAGGRDQRDSAYHQGTVWAWLIGPFIEAYLRISNFAMPARQQARIWLEPLVQHLNRGCLGQISEIFDADPPHTPRGAFAQAWSVAEVLRILALL
jgi:predicted glycogen debranching enzyme